MPRYRFTLNGTSGSVVTSVSPRCVILREGRLTLYAYPILKGVNRPLNNEPHEPSVQLFDSLDWTLITECRRLHFIRSEKLLRVTCEGHTFDLKWHS
jgi:hypothetical protein